MFKNLLSILLVFAIFNVAAQAQCPTIYVNELNLPSLPEGLTAGDDLELCFDLAVDEANFNPESVEFNYELLVDGTPSTVQLQTDYTSGTAIAPQATGQICFTAPVPSVADTCATFFISLEILTIFYVEDSCPSGTIAYDLDLPNYGFELQGDDLNELIPLLELAGFNPLEVEILAPSGCAGCTDPAACNYNPNLTIDDGSCAEFDCEGECDGNALAGAECDDGLSFTVNDTYQDDCTCSGELLGCTTIEACNYNPNAIVDDNSCLIEGESCDDGIAETVNDVIDSECNCTGVVGITLISETKGIKVYPTNFSNSLQFDFSEYENSKAVINIYSSAGKVVFNNNIQISNNSNFTFNTSIISKGIYIATIDIDQEKFMQKLIKH